MHFHVIILAALFAGLVKPAWAAPPAEPDKPASPAVTPLTAEEFNALLDSRLDGGMGYTFAKFSNMFMASSMIQLPSRVGLIAGTKEIAEAPLQAVFPDSYKPTLRELLDALALQTHSKWTYDPTGKHIRDDTAAKDPIDHLVIFEFVPTKRDKPFEVKLAEGWKAKDQGNWLMLQPPDFPVGLDVYEMGSYSADKPAELKDLLEKIPRDVSLEWADRAHKGAGLGDLKKAKVGPYDALFFEALIPSTLDKEVRWRQWVFMVDNKCYFIVSTIFPELEGKIFPDVEKMLVSFRLKEKDEQKQQPAAGAKP